MIGAGLLLVMSAASAGGSDHCSEIRRLLERGAWAEVERLLRRIERRAPREFVRHHYEYLRARLREERGDEDGAARAFRRVMERRDLLSPHAAWHLAEIARRRGQLEQERDLLLRALQDRPPSWLAERILWRLAENARRRGAFEEAIARCEEIAARVPALAPLMRWKSASLHLERQRKRAIEDRSGTSSEDESWRALLATLLEPRQGMGGSSGRSALAWGVPWRRLIQIEDLPGEENEIALEVARALDEWDRQRARALTPEEHRQRMRVYRTNRAFEEMRRHAESLIARFPDHAFVPEALLEIGRSYYAEGDFDRAILWFERVAERFPKTPEGEEGFYLVGHAHARAGRWEEALARYEAFLVRYPESERVAGAFLNAIDVLRSARRDEDALRWCQQMRARYAGRPEATAALFSEMRIHLGRGDHRAALEAIEQLLQFDLERPGPQRPSRQEILYWRGRVLEALERWEEAIATYMMIPDERSSFYGRRATERLRALWAHPHARDVLRRRFRKEKVEAEAALARGQQERARRAAALALRLTPDETSERHLRQLLVRTFRHLPESARDADHEIGGGLQWARFLITCEESARSSAGRDPRSRLVEGASARERARALICLGLYDEGAWDLAESVETERDAGDAIQARAWLYTLAVSFLRGGYVHEAMRVGETSLLPFIPKEYPLEMLPRDLLRVLYPTRIPSARRSLDMLTAFDRQIEEHIVRRGIDPALALAVIRQESRFRPDAKSPAAARGLAQFIPQTARRMAERAGWRALTERDLYRPEISLQLLGLYLRELLDRFAGNLPVVLAAYNAGEENARRWLDRARSDDPDRFVSEIGFWETKVYVQRVLEDIAIYRRALSLERSRTRR